MTPTTGSVTARGVAEATGVLDLSGWPAGMRVIVRKERPHPGAQSCGSPTVTGCA